VPEKLIADCLTLLSKIAEWEVANRPGRIEPRVLKRRRHGYKLMQELRHVLKNASNPRTPIRNSDSVNDSAIRS